jgi:hypothetical protein
VTANSLSFVSRETGINVLIDKKVKQTRKSDLPLGKGIVFPH